MNRMSIRSPKTTGAALAAVSGSSDIGLGK